MNTKIFFTDLDGTLLDDRKEISKGNQEAVDKALAAGHKVVISTGRPLSSARVLAHRLGLDKEGCYLIAYNGGVVYDSYREEILYGQALDEKLAGRIYTAAMEHGLHIQS